MIFSNLDSSSSQLVGRPIADQIKERLRRRVTQLPAAPGLAIINISPDPAAATYVRLKQRFGDAIGARVTILKPEIGELSDTIDRLNTDPSIHGIITQLPLPGGVLVAKTLARVAPAKDVDGLGPDSPFVTAGPRGIMELLTAYQVKLDGVQVALVGTGRLMGEPLGHLLAAAGAQVEAFNLERPLDPAILRQSDLIISATGQRHLITSDMVSPGTVVVDATGVDTDPALQQRDDTRITPATGGVGPMTVAALFQNLLDAVEQQLKS